MELSKKEQMAFIKLIARDLQSVDQAILSFNDCKEGVIDEENNYPQIDISKINWEELENNATYQLVFKSLFRKKNVCSDEQWEKQLLGYCEEIEVSEKIKSVSNELANAINSTFNEFVTCWMLRRNYRDAKRHLANISEEDYLPTDEYLANAITFIESKKGKTIGMVKDDPIFSEIIFEAKEKGIEKWKPFLESIMRDIPFELFYDMNVDGADSTIKGYYSKILTELVSSHINSLDIVKEKKRIIAGVVLCTAQLYTAPQECDIESWQDLDTERNKFFFNTGRNNLG